MIPLGSVVDEKCSSKGSLINRFLFTHTSDFNHSFRMKIVVLVSTDKIRANPRAIAAVVRTEKNSAIC